MSTTFRPSVPLPALCTVAVLSVLCPATAGLAQEPPQAHGGTKAAAESWDGVWIGSWGGGMQGGVIFQPVIAELAIRGEQVATHGFPGGNDVRGTFQVDAKAGQLLIQPEADPRTPAGGEIAYQYELKGKQLTLTTGDKKSIAFHKEGVTDPRADVPLQLVSAALDADGRLVVTEYVRFTTKNVPGTFFQPNQRKLDAQKAGIFVTEESAMQRLSLAEAQKLAAQPATVAIAFRPQQAASPNPVHERWKDLGPAPADDGAALATLAKSLRPGTLLFVFPHEESVPQP